MADSRTNFTNFGSERTNATGVQNCARKVDQSNGLTLNDSHIGSSSHNNTINGSAQSNLLAASTAAAHDYRANQMNNPRNYADDGFMNQQQRSSLPSRVPAFKPMQSLPYIQASPTGSPRAQLHGQDQGPGAVQHYEKRDTEGNGRPTGHSHAAPMQAKGVNSEVSDAMLARIEHTQARLTSQHGQILEKAHEQVTLAKEQVNLCDQMKLTIDRYFASLNDLLDETNYILTDWTTPQGDLASQCKAQVYARALDVEKRQLSPFMQYYEREFQRNLCEINRQQGSLELYINQYKMQTKQTSEELSRQDLQVPMISERHLGLVPSVFPPKSFQPQIVGAERAPTDSTIDERDEMTCLETQARYPFPQKHQMREVKQSASDLADILIGTNQLPVPERVPSLIYASDKLNREIFKDCQQFYMQMAQKNSTLACQTCLSKKYLPMQCRAAPTQSCYAETVNFLNSFKANLALKATSALRSRIRSSGGQSGSNEERDTLKENFTRLQQLDYQVQVGQRNREGLSVRMTFKNKIQLVMRIHNRFKVKSFTIGGAKEGPDSLSAEGKSGQNVFEYMNNQIEKIYRVYEAISDFPLGLLIVLVYMHSSVLFEGKCQCGRQFDFSGGGFGLLVPQFRDMWIRPEFLDHYKHNLCQTQRDLELN